jgi:hypothetical protein
MRIAISDVVIRLFYRENLIKSFASRQ